MSHKIDEKELEVLCTQTKIKVDEDKKSDMIERLNKDIAYVETLFSVNVEGIEPLFYVTNLPSMLREDKEKETMPNEDIMKLARSGEYGYIVVPAVPAALENSEHNTKRK